MCDTPTIGGRFTSLLAGGACAWATMREVVPRKNKTPALSGKFMIQDAAPHWAGCQALHREAASIAWAAWDESKEKVRSALNRATRKAGRNVATATGANFLYI